MTFSKQVYFDGNVVGRRGYIALGSAYFENGDCDYEPRREGRRGKDCIALSSSSNFYLAAQTKAFAFG